MEVFFINVGHQGLRGFLNTFLVELGLFQSDVRLFPQCGCHLYETFCRGGFLIPVSPGVVALTQSLCICNTKRVK
jgi:hypothetical protein